MLGERPRADPSPELPRRECGPASTLISDFQPPELGDSKLLFEPLCLWYLVSAAPVNPYTWHHTGYLDLKNTVAGISLLETVCRLPGVNGK